jgi:predicted lipoprotein
MSILQLILKIIAKCQAPYWRMAVLMPWLAMGCKPQTNRNDAGTILLRDGGKPINRDQVVQASGQCAFGLAKEFEARAKVLRDAAVTFAATANDSNRDAVRQAWHDAADSWQMNLAFQFGPAASSDSPGGEDIAAQIDAWPLYNRCAVEEILVSKSYETNFRALLVNRRGLHALEYLLFYEGNETACDANSPIVSQGTWGALSAEERASRRRAFAAAAAQDVADWSTQLVSRWDASFRAALASSSTGNAIFASTQAALNAVSDATYYVDVPMLSRKLAPPLSARLCRRAMFRPPGVDAQCSVETKYCDKHSRISSIDVWVQR